MITQSSRLGLERAGIVSTYRRPCSTIAFRLDRIHTKDLPTPFPLEPYGDNGDPSPDRMETKEPWPHGHINTVESNPS